MSLKLSDGGLAVVMAVAGRLPWRLRSAFLMELAAAFAGHEPEGLRRLAVEAAKRVVRIEAAESRAALPPPAAGPSAGGWSSGCAPCRPRRGIARMALPGRQWRRRVRRCGCLMRAGDADPHHGRVAMPV